MNLIDIGANLSHQSFAHDFDEVINSATCAGLSRIIVTGTDLESSRAALKLSKDRSELFSATAGFHPHVASTCSDADLQEIRQLASQPEVVAIGETGLDFNRNYSAQKDQLAIFEQHLLLAVDLQKPLFLHQRDAHDDFIRLLRKYRPDLVGGVVHCFTDSEAALMDYLELDMHIGITGWLCDERRGQELQGLVAKIPPHRLLMETDAPYLLPRTLKPKPKTRRNEPRHLVEVLKALADHTGRDQEAIARETTANALKLFKFSS